MLVHDRPWIPPGIGRGRRAITSTDAVTSADWGIVTDATSGTFAQNLPAAATAGAGFSYASYNSGTGTVTVTANGVETIRSPSGTATTFALIQGQGIVLACTGTAWEIIASTGIVPAPTTPVVVYDNAFTIKDETDPTKTMVFSVGPQATGADFTLSLGTQTADRTLTVPALNGAANLVVREAALTDNAVVRADSTLGLIQNSGVIIDDSNNVTGIGTLACSGSITFGTGSSYANGRFYNSSTLGTVLALQTGATYDFYLGTPTSGLDIITVPTGTQNVGFSGNIAQTGVKTFSTGTGTVTLNGNVTVTTGKTITAVSGIIFSDETLNQYDEGTWTPTILGSITPGTQTYSTQVGTYTRIGRLVTCVFNIGLSAYDAATNGNIFIGGFPFTCSSLVGFSSGGSFGFASNVTLGAGYTQLSFRIATSATTATLAKFGTAAASGTITQADVGATLALRGTIQYEI